MEILGMILLVLLGGITIIALFSALSLLIPIPIEKTRYILENMLGRSLLLGLVNFIFLLVLAAAFIWLSQNVLQFIAGIFIFLAGLILLFLVIFTLFISVLLTKSDWRIVPCDSITFSKTIFSSESNLSNIFL